ncbi:16S rRNA (cytosine(1402)-N(4))-methyltransferase RsmH [Alicyclobacillus mengziensis]|uniref:Ribosomal RNA small subunit methyltransferase H n=1 Tax=Alicyclobacillus mengziensis TaxID=2931921 RepID=A0A9X7W356_9BACL|nr:16S rRNA (cytosine(1402)-N(4))-methyltransferase RsmH [Alicyclobacillus mengziensis]QSO49826.1 16S rRNA (cytosine(1402)-N(4))-methyltransferase RsmH [Alicyclobacillus mengziensis]
MEEGQLQFQHESVLLNELVDSVQPKSGGIYVDCTVGGGGHTERLLQLSSPDGVVIGLDQDENALVHARERLAQHGTRLRLIHENFRRIAEVVSELRVGPVDGVVFDLGVSSPQFDVAERGFSYKADAKLDMRMDQTHGITAAEMVNGFEESRLVRVFFEYGEEKFSKSIARAIVRERAKEPIVTTGRLADIIRSAIPAPARRTGPHPARRVFQALRIAVNDELGALDEALDGAFQVLSSGGRLAVITFHSLEDKIVKHRFVDWCKGCECPPEFPVCVCGKKPRAMLVSRKAITPSEVELSRNQRSRSAKLRIVEKY